MVADGNRAARRTNERAQRSCSSGHLRERCAWRRDGRCFPEPAGPRVCTGGNRKNQHGGLGLAQDRAQRGPEYDLVEPGARSDAHHDQVSGALRCLLRDDGGRLAGDDDWFNIVRSSCGYLLFQTLGEQTGLGRQLLDLAPRLDAALHGSRNAHCVNRGQAGSMRSRQSNRVSQR